MDIVFILLINVKMPRIVVGILTFMSRINNLKNAAQADHGCCFNTVAKSFFPIAWLAFSAKEAR